MIPINRSSLIWAASVLLISSTAPGRADDCSALVKNFNQALELGHEAAAQAAIDRIAVDAQCGRFQVPAQRQIATFRLRAAQALMARGRPTVEFERLLDNADHAGVLWQAAATMGEVRFGERRFADAALGFDRAIEIVKNETLTPVAPSKFEIDELFERAAQSRILAANAKGAGEREGFVKTARSQRDGMLGGIYSPNVRGVTLLVVPVPVTFEYAKTTFTGVGEQAVGELVTAIKEQAPAKVVLVGHTDIRGGAEANMKLSLDRAQAVAKVLRDSGITTPVETIGKGATDPMHLTDTSGLSQEDIYALNRRVEWRRGD